MWSAAVGENDYIFVVICVIYVKTTLDENTYTFVKSQEPARFKFFIQQKLNFKTLKMTVVAVLVLSAYSCVMV